MSKLHSHSFRWKDFQTSWYKRWASELLQDENHLENHALHANKFWQNAVILQVLYERGLLRVNASGIGFGVGQERLPSLLAKHGVKVMATDQDFTTRNARHWEKQELAKNQQSLNRLGICSPEEFASNIDFRSVNMKKIPNDLYDKYDFLWSNCSLGHLGSIPAGLKFIKQSLRCLNPGGWAVHTTELNILSNDETVNTGNTVIFRLRDIYGLQRQLLRQGYVMDSFVLTPGQTPQDQRISLSPKFGNDFTKIQFQGHLLTQIVLIIHKPKEFSRQLLPVTYYRQLAASIVYLKNTLKMKHYRQNDPTINEILASRTSTLDMINLRPKQTNLKVKIKQDQKVTVRLFFDNQTDFPLFGVATLLNASPLVVATTEPTNHPSKFRDPSWLSANRPADQLRLVTEDSDKPVDYVQARQNFFYDVVLNSRKQTKGRYREDFCLIQEMVGWIDSTHVRVDIDII